MAMFANVWQCITMFGNVKECLAMYGNVTQCVTRSERHETMAPPEAKSPFFQALSETNRYGSHNLRMYGNLCQSKDLYGNV